MSSDFGDRKLRIKDQVLVKAVKNEFLKESMLKQTKDTGAQEEKLKPFIENLESWLVLALVFSHYAMYD